ncbi:uncharacterized protein PHACADRAFT_194380 [Phanerochaete carnosa HHB-10118-sp]|uniref:DUF6534 domain-containing protein n=1 Tax=Phanerochaete carnosa (strain HHB-10118-sp) TaxID=650164 RepID=K5WCU2_PHACS|nr:uncharacterized protein PHACADRAFT_194380 [Phanerochaete carnosa HHB-10118-sp]EKM56794.1 hypothetical protein PHACADRAFT_194380 [Phanerochaete carnosa HHB-10118-sp]
MATQSPLPSNPQSPGLNTSSTLGAILIGGFVAAMLYGIIVLQTLLFFQGQSHNSRYMVIGLLLISSAHMALVIHPVYCQYRLECIGGNNLDGEHRILDISNLTSYCATQAVNDFIRLISEALPFSWFVYRIWVLSHRNHWITYPMTVLCVFLFGLTLATGIKTYQTKTYFQLVQVHLQWLPETDLSLVVVADGLIAAILCYLLATSRMRVMNRRTESYLNILILYTINTGLLTSMLSMACLITFVTMPDNFIFWSLYFPMVNLYANSLLASFNLRDSLKSDPASFAAPLSTIKFHQRSTVCHCSCHSSHSAHPERINDTESGGGNLVIHVQTEQSKVTL